MFILKRCKIRSYEMGLYFRDREFRGLLEAGAHWFLDPLHKVRVDVVSKREPWIVHEKLDLIVKSGALTDRAIVLDLKDHERALVWIEKRFSHILPAVGDGSFGTLSPDAPERSRARVQRAEQAVFDGLYAYWTGQKDVRVEVVDVRNVRFEHDELKVIARSPMVHPVLDVCAVSRDHLGVLFIDGRYVDTLAPGLYAFWKGQADAPSGTVDSAQRSSVSSDASPIVEALKTDRLCLVEVDLRETMIAGVGRRGRFLLVSPNEA